MATTRYLVLPEVRLAYESAVRVRDGEAKCLSIVGPSGSGKSALVRAVFSATEPSRTGAQRSTSDVLSAEAWVEATSKSEADGTPADVAAGYVRASKLVIEDIAQLRSRRGRVLQDQFCDLVDSRLERGLATVVTAENSPGPSLGLSPRLTDRLQGGLVTKLETLSPESRVRLAVDVAQRRALRVTAEQLTSVAELLGETAGAVEIAVQQLEKLTIRRQSDVNEDLLMEFRRRNRTEKLSISAITREVAKEFSAKVSDLRAAGRTQAVVLPRQTAMFLARTVANEPYQAIGRYFGGRNHSTVVHSVKRIERMLGDSVELASRVSSIRSQLNR